MYLYSVISFKYLIILFNKSLFSVKAKHFKSSKLTLKMDNKEKIKLEETIEELENIKGRHTELVTVYIPSDFNITTVIRQLEAEAGTASNIKSKNTRKSVLIALERISRELKLYKQTPKNGMAVFYG